MGGTERIVISSWYFLRNTAFFLVAMATLNLHSKNHARNTDFTEVYPKSAILYVLFNMRVRVSERMHHHIRGHRDVCICLHICKRDLREKDRDKERKK